MPSMSEGARPTRASLRSTSRRFRPLSMRSRVAAVESRPSATRQFPLLPLEIEAKRSNGLFQLLVQKREDALRGLRGFRGAVLVEHVHAAGFLLRLDLHAVLLGLDLRVLGVEQIRQQAGLLHFLLRIGVAHEVDAVLAVAVLDGKADAVERKPDS